jgi:hypothetical protein
MEQALCKGISFMKRLIVKGVPYGTGFLQRAFLMEKALCRESSLWKMAFVKVVPYRGGSLLNKLFVKGFPS